MTYLVDVTVRPAADALDQLEVVLRVSAGDVRTAAHLPGCWDRSEPDSVTQTEPDRAGHTDTNIRCQHNFNMASSASRTRAHCCTHGLAGWTRMPSGAVGEVGIYETIHMELTVRNIRVTSNDNDQFEPLFYTDRLRYSLEMKSTNPSGFNEQLFCDL